MKVCYPQLSPTSLHEEVDRELTKVIEDFDRAMNFEALGLHHRQSDGTMNKLNIILKFLAYKLRFS